MSRYSVDRVLMAMGDGISAPEDVPGMDARVARAAMGDLRRAGLATWGRHAGWCLSENGRLYRDTLAASAAPVPVAAAGEDAHPALAWLIGQIPLRGEPFPREQRELVIAALGAWLDLLYGQQDDAEAEAPAGTAPKGERQ